MSSSSEDDSHMIVKEEDIGDDMDLWESQPRRSAFSPYRVGFGEKLLVLRLFVYVVIVFMRVFFFLEGGVLCFSRLRKVLSYVILYV